MKRTLLTFLALLPLLSGYAQFENYNNIEVSIGHKALKANTSGVNFVYQTTDTVAQNTISGEFAIRPASPVQLQLGTDFYVANHFLALARGWFAPNDFNTWGVSLGVGYRHKLNYFIRLQPEFRLFLGQVTLPFGKAQYTGERLTFEDVKYLPGAEISAKYRNVNFSLVPAAKMTFDLARRWELRVSASYHIGIVNSEAVVIESILVPGQSVKKVIPFKAETASVIQNEAVPEKTLVRFSGASMQVGVGFKFMR